MFTRFLFKPHKYIKVILAILLGVIVITSFSSCAIKNNSEQNHLVYYTLNDEDSVCVELIQKYNNYCLKNLEESYQIEIVEFDSEDTMLTKISTEIMAGKGPDIISLNQKLPFEKLIDNCSFADIDELAELYKSDIDFDDYNSTIMDCGIYNGKRYIIPIAYCPNILITTQEILDKYNLENTNFSFKELGIRLSDKDHSYALFGNIGVIYATVFVAVFHIFCWTHGIMLLDKGGFQLKKLINPCLIAVIAGMAFFIFQIRLPESIDFAMGAIGDMNTPLAMLLSGAIMTQLNFKEVLTKRRLFFVALLRLIVSAGLFCLLLRFLPIDDQMRTVAAVTAACPAGAMTITMAIMYEHDDHYATELFTVTTLLSILTMPLCMLIAG